MTRPITVYMVRWYSNDEGFIEEYSPTIKDARGRRAEIIRDNRKLDKEALADAREQYGGDCSPPTPAMEGAPAIFKLTIAPFNTTRELACALLNQTAYVRDSRLVFGTEWCHEQRGVE